MHAAYFIEGIVTLAQSTCCFANVCVLQNISFSLWVVANVFPFSRSSDCLCLMYSPSISSGDFPSCLPLGMWSLVIQCHSWTCWFHTCFLFSACSLTGCGRCFLSHYTQLSTQTRSFWFIHFICFYCCICSYFGWAVNSHLHNPCDNM